MLEFKYIGFINALAEIFFLGFWSCVGDVLIVIARPYKVLGVAGLKVIFTDNLIIPCDSLVSGLVFKTTYITDEIMLTCDICFLIH